MQTTHIILIVLFIMLFLHLRSNRMMAKQLIKSKDPKERQNMLELAKSLIGKECIIYTFNSNQLECILREVGETGILVERSDKSREIVNADFIIRIREHPKKGNGKKKSVIFD